MLFPCPHRLVGLSMMIINVCFFPQYHQYFLKTIYLGPVWHQEFLLEILDCRAFLKFLYSINLFFFAKNTGCSWIEGIKNVSIWRIPSDLVLVIRQIPSVESCFLFSQWRLSIVLGDPLHAGTLDSFAILLFIPCLSKPPSLIFTMDLKHLASWQLMEKIL